MEEEIEGLYKEYLRKRLHLIFKDPENPNLPLIVHDGYYILENEDGWEINYKWYKKIYEYKDGYALAADGSHFNFLDEKGKPLSKSLWFDDASSFSCGYARIQVGDKFNFIDTNGKLLKKDVWYNYVGNFANGYAIVMKPRDVVIGNIIQHKPSYNFINTNGDLIGDTWYDEVRDFHEGYAAVSKGPLWNFIDTSGKPVFYTSVETWYEDVGDFVNGYAVVRKNGKWNWINTNGELISKEGYSGAITNFKYGYAVVGDMHYKVVDTTGRPICDDLYNNIYIYEDRIVVRNNLFRYAEMDKNGKIVSKWYSEPKLLEYRAKKTLTGYTFRTQYGEFKTKYKPVDVINKKFILCEYLDVKKGEYCNCLYNTETNEYLRLGVESNIERQGNFICNANFGTKKYYFVYGNGFYDITEYYKMYLDGKENIHINPGIELLSKEEFYLKHQEEAKKKMKDKAEAKERKGEITKIQDLKKQNDEEEKQLEDKRKETINGLKTLLKTLEELDSEKVSFDRFPVNNLFVTVSDHKEIDPLCFELNILKHIDLSKHSFLNAKVNGIDFSGCNICFNPQEVYNKDLSNCNFEGVFFPVSTDFSGVNICGSRFSTNNNPTVFDINFNSFVDAIYDDNTTLDGIPLQMIYESINTSKGSK